ncbi:MAG: hypothetical protein SVT52_09020, partial [Planctomycetota bacterium]|nr:hypothetical protein [Planctomycetota bacterium]
MPNAMDLLRPEVRAYSHKGYELEYDLYHLQRSQEVSIRDATVFYAARILEALSAAALETMGLKGKENAFSNLTRLEEYGLLPPHTLYWAHALRRTGNAVRHAKSRTAPQEAETSVAFLEYWLRWFFCVFPYGARLDDLTMEAGGGLFIRDADLSRILGMIEANDPAPGRVAQQVMEGSYEKIKHAPAVLAVLAERLLRTNRLAEARGFLDWSAGLHGEDLRLLQLRGLCHSRMGLLDEAIEILEPSYKRYRTDDEMIG